MADTSGFPSYESSRDHDTPPILPLTRTGSVPNEFPGTRGGGRGAPPEHREIGPYEVVEEIGRGGMGVVYRARQPGLERDVAIKVMLAGEHAGDDAFDRFVREARSAGKLRHPGIVGVHDVGLQDGVPYIVMDFVKGRSLAEVLRDEDVTVRRAAEIAAQVADALQHAHDHEVIHRDVKPGNILIDDATGTPLLTDFGLARDIGAAKGLTQSGAAVGTPAYMSPEQAAGQRVDGRTDVYGLGAVLYEMLSGRVPFEGSNQYQIMGRVLRDEPVPIRRIAPQVPRDAELIASAAMTKEAARRYQSAEALGNDCRRLLRGEAISAHAPSVWYLLNRRVRRHRVPLLAAAVSLLLTAILVFMFGVRPGLLEAAQDRAALRGALRSRQALETDFRRLVAGGRYNDAIEQHRQHFGVTPALPILIDSRRAAEPEFAELHEPYRIDLPAAYLARGAQRLAEGDPLARGDIANAFRAGRDVPAHVETARTAMLMLSRELIINHDLEPAAYTLGLVRKHFGVDHARTRALLAELRQRQGRLAEAAALWDSVRDDAALREEADFQLAALRLALPVQSVPDPGAGWVLVDLGRDGAWEACRMDALGAVRVRRWEADAWTEVRTIILWPESRDPPRRMQLVDCDADGEPEIVLDHWDPAARAGYVVVIEWNDGEPARAGEGAAPVPLEGFTAIDLDGDGTTEWIQRGRRMLHVWRYGRGTVRYLNPWNVLCDVHGIWRRPDAGLMLWLGPWRIATPYPLAWRLADPGMYLGPRDGTPHPATSLNMRGGSVPCGYRIVTLGHESGGWIRPRAAVPGRFLEGSLSQLSDGSLLFTAGYNAETKKVLPELRRGIFRAAHSGAAFAEPQPFGDERNNRRLGAGAFWEVAIDGVAHVATHTRGVLRLIPLDGGRERVFGLRGGFARYQLDSDRQPELLWRGSDETAMEVRGRGSYTPRPWREVLTSDQAEVERAGTLRPEQELLEAGLHAETVQACRERLRTADEPQVQYFLGQALAELGRYGEAAEAFAAAARGNGLVTDALLRRAHALQQLRDWKALAGCLERLQRSRLADAFARSASVRRLGWVRPAAAMSPRIAWSSWAGTPTQVAESPFRIAHTADGPRCFSTGDSAGGAYGRLFHYDGGPLRITVRFRPGAIEWGANIAFGIQSISTLDADAGYPGSDLKVWCQARGATDNPIVFWGFAARARDGRGGYGRTGSDQIVLETGREFTAVIDYVPGLDRAWCELRDADGTTQARLPEIAIPVPLERGVYLAGRPSRGTKGQSDQSFVAEIQLLEIRISGGKAVKEVDHTPSTARGWLALANGSLVAGALDRAGRQYARALELLDVRNVATDAPVRARVHLYRALQFLRQDRLELARESMRKAMAVHAPAVAHELEARRPAALSRPELRFLRGIALR